MKIILEASPLLHTLTGIGRYTWELATRLPYHSEIDDFALYVRNEIIQDVNELNRMSKESKDFPLLSKPIRLTSRWIKHQNAKRQCHNSLVHGPNYFLPMCTESGIVTVHDLSVLRHPETHPIERVLQFEKNFNHTLSRTRHIITDSEAMRREIIELLNWSDKKISVIPLGVAPEFTPYTNVNHDFLNQYGLSVGGYTLCISTIEPRKNIDKLLLSYGMLTQNLRIRFPLVIIGGIGWLAESIVAQIEKGVHEGWVIRPGFVPDNELILFYSHARLFVYPSSYEGFGLPAIEAMASGIPLIVSNRTSLPEVTQGAALVIEPDDIEAFSIALKKGLEDIQWCKQSIRDGLEVVKKYTWEKCVDETVKIYKNISSL